ncbi:hypothetical protein [Actinoplanes sp. NPDC051494]|uniref:hypothetical protein n=1 Tax=Actinoplanes sp. NPDC051494 TaxID=3363907 RepID=UPI0037AC2315
MRPTGYRRFRFTSGDTGWDTGLRLSVFPREVPLYWRVWATCRREDIRWAFANGGDQDRFTALALEHAAARRQGRQPDPEVDAVKTGPWWARARWVGRCLTAAAATSTVMLGLAVIALAALERVGVVQVQVSWR